VCQAQPSRALQVVCGVSRRVRGKRIVGKENQSESCETTGGISRGLASAEKYGSELILTLY